MTDPQGVGNKRREGKNGEEGRLDKHKMVRLAHTAAEACRHLKKKGEVGQKNPAEEL